MSYRRPPARIIMPVLLAALVAAGPGLPQPANMTATVLDGLRALTAAITVHTGAAGQHGQVMATVGIRN